MNSRIAPLQAGTKGSITLMGMTAHNQHEGLLRMILALFPDRRTILRLLDTRGRTTNQDKE